MSDLTAEQHTNDLMAAIDREIDRYGVVSLADFVASTIDGRCDDEQPHYLYWSEVRHVFERACDTLAALNRTHGMPQSKRGER